MEDLRIINLDLFFLIDKRRHFERHVPIYIYFSFFLFLKAFSPSNKYVVSVGSQHDMIVNVWDWRNNVKVASNKVSSKVKAVCFAENGNYFVTVGNRHVKFWYLEYSRSAKVTNPISLSLLICSNKINSSIIVSKIVIIDYRYRYR